MVRQQNGRYRKEIRIRTDIKNWGRFDVRREGGRLGGEKRDQVSPRKGGQKKGVLLEVSQAGSSFSQKANDMGLLSVPARD